MMCSGLSDDENKVVDKRQKVALGIWDKISRSSVFVNDVDGVLFHLNENLFAEVVVHYINDLRALKSRYKINGKVQFPKIAGLMTNAIAKYKPIVPRKGNCKLNAVALEINELFAIFHGICVLFDIDVLTDGTIVKKTGDAISSFIASNVGLQWRKDMHYLLRCRNYTAENLITTFETLCLTLSPELLNYEIEG